jgi:signal transduction histidine kinase
MLRLWGGRVKISDPAEIQDMVRFNEAIDQALTESVARYSEILRESQNLFLAILGHDVRTPLGAISMGGQIHNNGEVIAPEKLQTIFDPAKRFALRPAHERTLAQTQNLGLGLYIAREIIRAHGGRISIASSVVKGTTFTIHLPQQVPGRGARVNIQEHNLSWNCYAAQL